MFENEKKEDYMGMVSWHRNMGTPKTLFGTEIQSNPITLTIKRATECRDKVIQLAGELNIELYAGYLESSHDDNNLIIADTKSEQAVYFNTLNREE